MVVLPCMHEHFDCIESSVDSVDGEERRDILLAKNLSVSRGVGVLLQRVVSLTLLWCGNLSGENT